MLQRRTQVLRVETDQAQATRSCRHRCGGWSKRSAHATRRSGSDRCGQRSQALDGCRCCCCCRKCRCVRLRGGRDRVFVKDGRRVQRFQEVSGALEGLAVAMFAVQYRRARGLRQRAFAGAAIPICRAARSAGALRVGAWPGEAGGSAERWCRVRRVCLRLSVLLLYLDHDVCAVQS